MSSPREQTGHQVEVPQGLLHINPCAPVAADNPFVPDGATFRNMFSWRNHKNGISFGSVASLNLLDAVVADNMFF